MPDIFDSEIDNCLRSNSYFHMTVNTMSLITKAVLVLNYGPDYLESPIIHFLFPLTLLLYACLATRLARSQLSKRVAIFISTEISLLIIKKASYDSYENRVVFSLLATGAVINYQIQIVRSYVAVTFISLKHLAQWHFLDIFRGDLESGLHSASTIPILGYIALMLVHKNHHNQHVTSLHKFSVSIRENYHNLQNLMKSLQCGLISLNSDFSLKHINPKAKDLLSCDDETFPHVFSHLPYHHSEAGAAMVMEDIEAQHSMNVSSSLALGSVFIGEKHVSLNLSKIQWSNSYIYVLLLTDVTDTVQLETFILDSALKLRFLNFIPHELYTPTVGILNCTEAMIHAYKEGALQFIWSNLEMVLHSTRRLHLMICNISDYTQILAGEFLLNSTEERIENTVETSLELIRQQATAQGIALKTRIDPFIPTYIETDHQRLQQVITILLSNALKYTYTGYIEIVVVLERPGTIRVEVNDSGIGITPENLENIHRQLQNPQSGTLMFGLEVSDKIARKIGDMPLKIQSLYGTSVSFIVTVGFSDQEFLVFEESSQSTIPFEEFKLLGIPEFSVEKKYSQVLIVDDMESSRAVLARIMERENILYLEARDGQQAVDLVVECDRKHKPLQLIIMDIDMPLMDGWEATQIIVNMAQKLEISKQPFIVGYSAFTAPAVIEKAKHIGMITYIKKPARAVEIARIIKNLVNNLY